MVKQEANLNISYGWDKGEGDWNVGMDENLVKLGTVSQISVTNMTQTAPPVSYTAGERFIVGSPATGAFLAKEGMLAVAVESSYKFYTVKKGWQIFNEADEKVYVWDGAAFVEPSAAAIAAAVAAEAAIRAAADTSEAAARAAADTTLQGNITSEASARAAADTTLQNNIDAEAASRANGDSLLNSTKQENIQFKDEGVDLGTPGTAIAVDFTGAGVTASRTGDTITVNVSGGGGGGGTTCDLALGTSGAVGYGALPADVSGMTVSKTITTAPEQGRYLGHGSAIPMWADKRILEVKDVVFSGVTSGNAQASLVLSNPDMSKVLLAGYIGSGWVFRLMTGAVISGAAGVGAPASARVAIGIDGATGDCYAFCDGARVTSGAFAPGGLAEGFFAGQASVTPAIDLAFQSEGTLSMTMVQNANSMRYGYEGFNDLCGNESIFRGDSVITADTTKTVGAAGDFATLALALAWAKQQVVTNGARVTINVLNSVVIGDGVDLSWVDAPWLDIKFDDTVGVALDGSTFTPHPLFGVKVFLFLLGSNIGSISGKVVPTNIADVKPFYGIFSKANFGDMFTATPMDFGSGWGGALTFSDTRSIANVAFDSLGQAASVSGRSDVVFSNCTITGVAGTLYSPVIVVNGGSLRIEQGTITSDRRAIEASSNADVFISGSTITGGLAAGYGGKITGTIDNLNTPTNALPNGWLFDTQTGGEIDVKIQTSFTLASPHLASILASSSYGGNTKIQVDPAITGVSTGVPAVVATGGRVNIISAGGNVAAAFTGSIAQPVNVQTHAGLITFSDNSATYYDSWSALPLENSWSAIAGWQTPEFKVEGNTLWIKFALDSGTALGLATLPVGARPAEKRSLWVNVHDNTDAPDYGHMVVNTDGTIVLEHPGSISGHKVFCTAPIPLS